MPEYRGTDQGHFCDVLKNRLLDVAITTASPILLLYILNTTLWQSLSMTV